MFAALAEEAPPLSKGVEGQHRLDAIQVELQGLESQISQLQARRVELAAEVHAMQQLSGMTAAAWVAWAGGLTPREAGRACHLAKRLPKLPAIAAAFADGRLSEGVVASMVAVATPDNEQILVGLSEIATGAQLQTLFGDYRRQSEKPPTPADEYVSYGADAESGLWKLNAGLTPEHGAEVEAALRAARESVDETAEHDRRCERPDEQPTASAVDALLAMATYFLGSTVTRAGVVPDRFQTILHVEEGRDAYLHNGCGTLDDDTTEACKCEGTVGMIIKRNGNVVTIVSPTRLATRDQILALKARDRCCVFPGCGRQNFLIAHHVIHHADGGATHIYNLVLLCKPHHRLVHRPGWRITLNTDATVKRFFRPDGTQVKPVNPRAGPAPPLPNAGPRNTGTGERLTEYGRDILLHHWLTHEEPGNPSNN